METPEILCAEAQHLSSYGLKNKKSKVQKEVVEKSFLLKKSHKKSLVKFFKNFVHILIF